MGMPAAGMDRVGDLAHRLAIRIIAEEPIPRAIKFAVEILRERCMARVVEPAIDNLLGARDRRHLARNRVCGIGHVHPLFPKRAWENSHASAQGRGVEPGTRSVRDTATRLPGG